MVLYTGSVVNYNRYMDTVTESASLMSGSCVVVDAGIPVTPDPNRA